MHDRGQDFVSRQSAQRHVFLHPPSDFSQLFSEDEHLLVFVFVTHFAPAFVIAILFAPAIIFSRRLKVAIGRRANPNIPIRRRDGETIDAQDALFVADRFTFGIEIDKARTITFPRVTGLIVTDVAQSGFLGRLFWIGCYFEFSGLLFLSANA